MEYFYYFLWDAVTTTTIMAPAAETTYIHTYIIRNTAEQQLFYVCDWPQWPITSERIYCTFYENYVVDRHSYRH